MTSVAARFFPPQVAGAGATVGQPGGDFPFRIDHDEKFNQTTHFKYQIPGKHSPWVGFNWRYDSGLVAGSAPCYNVTDPNSVCAAGSIFINGQPGIDLSGLTPDEQSQAGLACNGVAATHSVGIPGGKCLASQLTSTLLNIPAPSTEDDDHNPPRISPATSSTPPSAKTISSTATAEDLEPPPHRRQPRQQVRSLQLPLHLLRHALRHPPRPDRRTGLPLLISFARLPLPRQPGDAPPPHTAWSARRPALSRRTE